MPRSSIPQMWQPDACPDAGRNRAMPSREQAPSTASQALTPPACGAGLKGRKRSSRMGSGFFFSLLLNLLRERGDSLVELYDVAEAEEAHDAEVGVLLGQLSVAVAEAHQDALCHPVGLGQLFLVVIKLSLLHSGELPDVHIADRERHLPDLRLKVLKKVSVGHRSSLYGLLREGYIAVQLVLDLELHEIRHGAAHHDRALEDALVCGDVSGRPYVPDKAHPSGVGGLKDLLLVLVVGIPHHLEFLVLAVLDVGDVPLRGVLNSGLLNGRSGRSNVAEGLDAVEVFPVSVGSRGFGVGGVLEAVLGAGLTHQHRVLGFVFSHFLLLLARCLTRRRGSCLSRQQGFLSTRRMTALGSLSCPGIFCGSSRRSSCRGCSGFHWSAI